MEQRFNNIIELLKSKIPYKNETFDNKGVEFQLCNLKINACVCHYLDTLDDGDVFYYDDNTDEEIVNLILQEAV